jgi:hypothetical protein
MAHTGRVGCEAKELSSVSFRLPVTRRLSNGPGTELEDLRERLETWQYRSNASAKKLSVIHTLSEGARIFLRARPHRAGDRGGIGIERLWSRVIAACYISRQC